MIVVSDCSPLISLAKIKQFSLLKHLFDAIFVPEAVYNEVVVPERILPGSKEIDEVHWIKKRKIGNSLKSRRLERTYNLGAGEAATIVLAKEMRADLALIDERRARLVALSESLNVMGTLGILELSYSKNLISDLREVYQRLRSENIRIHDNLLNDSLRRFGFKEL